MAPEPTEAPPEFPTEEHRESHVAALIREKDGYETKAAGFKERGDAEQAKYYTGRATQVQAELDRLAGDAKTGRARAETR